MHDWDMKWLGVCNSDLRAMDSVNSEPEFREFTLLVEFQQLS